MGKYNTTDRLDWIITLRVIAAIAIVLLHVVAGWVNEAWSDKITGIRLIVDGVIIQVLVRWAVPCFLMISGALLLNPQKDLSITLLH